MRLRTFSTQTISYTLYGVKQADIAKIITTNVRKQIDTTKQQILKDGADKATYKIDTTAASGPIQAVLNATSLAGPDIQIPALKSQLAGKKPGDVKSVVKLIPGVSDATVNLSPFWVTSVPTKTSKITIIILKSAMTPGSASNDSSKP